MQRLGMMFRHNAVRVMAAIFVLAVLWLALNGPAWAWTCVVFGIPAQMMNEYALHRYIFHLPPPRRQWAFNLLYQAHYGHHDFQPRFRRGVE